MKSEKSWALLTAAVVLGASSLAEVGTFNPKDPEGAPNPVPLVNQPLVPDAVAPLGNAFTLTVNGTGFVSDSVVNWNGDARETTFVTGSKLNASILASDIAEASTASITVSSPSPGGGTSNEVLFSVTPPSSSVAFSLSIFSAAPGPKSVATSDFNGDGKVDLVVGDAVSGEVSILLGNGDGTFQPAVNYRVGGGSSLQNFQIAVGDFNADGRMDFAVSNGQDHTVSVFLGNGDGRFQAGVNYNVGPYPTSVAVADFNRDGKLDLVVTDQNCGAEGSGPCGPGTVSILLGNGDGTFQTHSDYDCGTGPNWVSVGDLNADDTLDLAVVDGQGDSLTSALSILLGNGDGTFQRPFSYPLAINGASGATADLNGDGILDAVAVDNIGLLSIFLGNGDGTFGPRVDYGTGAFPWGAVGVGDFNADGRLDLAVANSIVADSVSIFLGNGDGTFQPQLMFETGPFPQGVAVGDFNQDGRLDLALPNYSGSSVSVLLQFNP